MRQRNNVIILYSPKVKDIIIFKNVGAGEMAY